MLGLPGGCNATRAARDVTGSVCHRPKTFSLLRAPQSQHGSIKILNYPKTFPFSPSSPTKCVEGEDAAERAFRKSIFQARAAFQRSPTPTSSMFSHRPCWCLVFPFERIDGHFPSSLNCSCCSYVAGHEEPSTRGR